MNWIYALHSFGNACFHNYCKAMPAVFSKHCLRDCIENPLKWHASISIKWRLAQHKNHTSTRTERKCFGVNCEMISASDMQTASSSPFAQVSELYCATKRGKKLTKAIQVEKQLTGINNRQCGEFVVYWFQKFRSKCDWKSMNEICIIQLRMGISNDENCKMAWISYAKHDNHVPPTTVRWNLLWNQSK